MDAIQKIHQCYRVVESLPEGKRLWFYELFSLQLTGAIRVVIGDPTLGEREKLKRIDLLNEILHRSTAKVSVLRLRTHDWTEKSFWEMVAGYVSLNRDIADMIHLATQEAHDVLTSGPG